MLGIANPSLISVDELKRSTSFNRGKTPLRLIAGSVDVATKRGIVLHLAKNAISVVARTTSVTCVRSQMVTQGGQDGPMGNVPIDVRYMRLMKCHSDMENLTEQVQSLFYS